MEHGMIDSTFPRLWSRCSLLATGASTLLCRFFNGADGKVPKPLAVAMVEDFVERVCPGTR